MIRQVFLNRPIVILVLLASLAMSTATADKLAELDRVTTYPRGATGTDSGKLTVGNYNETIQSHGKDRQFRGRLRGIQVFGSRIAASGALLLSTVRKRQHED
jgi:hypothetical protein